MRQLFYRLMNLRSHGRLFDLLLGRQRIAPGNVLPHRAAKQQNLLRHITNSSAQPGYFHFRTRYSIDQDITAALLI
ncbi:hypothetical protein D3C75_1077030 [compost metagenome]